MNLILSVPVRRNLFPDWIGNKYKNLDPYFHRDGGSAEYVPMSLFRFSLRRRNDIVPKLY